MEGVIIFIVVGGAVFYIGRSYYRKFKTAESGSCCSGCSTCSKGAACTENDNEQGQILACRPDGSHANNHR